MAADDVLLRVYQDWVHQNFGTHLDDGINEDGKWQVMWKITCIFYNPILRCTVYLDRHFFVSTLATELDGIRAWRWNADRVIVL